jgi:hypothetical protein
MAKTKMFDPNFKRVTLATYIVCQMPLDVREARATLKLARQIAPAILKNRLAQNDALVAVTQRTRRTH